MLIPHVETSRLLLREIRETDLDAAHAMWSDPDVFRYLSGKSMTREEVWGSLLRLTGHWAFRDFGYWAAEEKASGEFVGVIGYGDFKREMTPRLDNTLEIGWVLSTAYHGKGYATEGARAAIDWARAKFPKLPFTCIIAPENAPSINVAKKLGFTKKHVTAYKDQPTLVMEMN